MAVGDAENVDALVRIQPEGGNGEVGAVRAEDREAERVLRRGGRRSHGTIDAQVPRPHASVDDRAFDGDADERAGRSRENDLIDDGVGKYRDSR